MIIDDYITFRVKYEKKMMDRYSCVTLDDDAIIKLFLGQKKIKNAT